MSARRPSEIVTPADRVREVMEASKLRKGLFKERQRLAGVLMEARRYGESREYIKELEQHYKETADSIKGIDRYIEQLRPKRGVFMKLPNWH